MKGIQLDLDNNQGLDNIGILGRIGFPTQVIYFRLDSSISFSYLFEYDSDYDNSKSSTYTTKSEYKILSQYHKGIEFTETIQLNQILIEQYILLSIESFPDNMLHRDYTKNAYIGIGKGSGSFIDVLYKRHMIDYRKFQFVEQKLSLGEFIRSYYDDNDNITEVTCNILPSIKDYACNLSAIIFDTNNSIDFTKKKEYSLIEHHSQINIDSYMTFDTKKSYLCFPMKYYESFKEMFINTMTNDTCIIYDFGERITFECDYNKFNKELKMYMIIGDISLMLNYEDLLLVENRYSVMKTLGIQFLADLPNIIFGYILMKKYSIGISEEDNTVTFYRNNNRLVDLLTVGGYKEGEVVENITKTEKEDDLINDDTKEQEDDLRNDDTIVKEQQAEKVDLNMKYLNHMLLFVCICMLFIGIINAIIARYSCHESNVISIVNETIPSIIVITGQEENNVLLTKND